MLFRSGLLTELEAGGGLGGERDDVAGDPPRTALRVLRRERPRADGDVDPVHRPSPRRVGGVRRPGAAVGIDLGVLAERREEAKWGLQFRGCLQLISASRSPGGKGTGGKKALDSIARLSRHCVRKPRSEALRRRN